MSDNFNQIPINVSNSTSRQTNINNNNNNNNNNIKSQSTYHTSRLIENETDAEASDLEHLDFKMESPKNEKTYFYNNNNNNNNSNNDDDLDEVSPFRDPPFGCVRLRPSQFHNIPGKYLK